MKKKIAIILMAFVMLVPSLFLLTACGEEPFDSTKVSSIAVELVNENYTMTDNTITLSYGPKVSLSAEDFKVTATLDDNTTKEVFLKTENEDGFTFSSTLPAEGDKTPVGEYTVTLACGDASLEIKVNVIKTTVDMSNVAWNYSEPFVYDKTEKEVSITGLPEGVSVVYEGTRKATNAGTYAVTARFICDSANYNPISNMTTTWEISKATIVVSGIEVNIQHTYSGTEQEVGVANLNTTNLPENVIITGMTGQTSGTNAGDYNIAISFEYTGEDKANYNPIADYETTWKIHPAVYTSVGSLSLEQDTFEYSASYIRVNIADESTLNSKVAITTMSGYEGKNVGEYTLVVNLRYTGTDGNYASAVSIEIPWSITPKALTVSVEDTIITYGENPTANVSYSGFAGGESETTAGIFGGALAIDYDGYVVGSNVGTYDMTASGLTATNYTINYEGGTLTVERASLVVKANDATVSFEEGLPTNYGVQVTGLVAGDTLEDLGTIQYHYGGWEEGAPVVEGGYTITPSGLTSTNYDITYLPGTITVTKINVPVSGEELDEIELTQSEFEYKGSAYEFASSLIDPSTLPQGVTVTEVRVINGQAENVGEYTLLIYLQYSDTTNYNPMGQIERTIRITPAQVNVSGLDAVTLTENTLVYNGQSQMVSVDAETIPSGVAVGTISGEYSATNVGEYTISVTFVCSSDNYSNFAPVTKTFTWNITPATVYVKANNGELTYKQPVPANGFGYTLTGFVGADEANQASIVTGSPVYNYGGYTAGSNKGAYTITITGGFSASNYTFNYESTDATLTVNPLTVDVSGISWSGVANEYTYTGNAVKPTIVSLPEGVRPNYEYSAQNPINVGNYTATVTLSAINDNYLVEAREIAFNYTITKAQINLAGVAWQSHETEYTYTGEVVRVSLNRVVIDGVTISYAYYVNSSTGFVQAPDNHAIAVGEYKATATITLNDSTNYEIINNNIGETTFVITKAIIDLSGVAWEIENNHTFYYTGEKIEVKLNRELPAVVGVTYTYTLSGEPVAEAKEVGNYRVSVSIELIDSDNYDIVNATVQPYLDFSIQKRVVNASSFTWDVDGEVEEKTQSSITYIYYGDKNEPYLKSEHLECVNVEYYHLIDEIDKTPGLPYIEEDGNTNYPEGDFYARITIKEEYAGIVDFEGEEIILSVYVDTVHKAFEYITLNGQPLTEEELIQLSELKYGSVLEISLNDGYIFRYSGSLVTFTVDNDTVWIDDILTSTTYSVVHTFEGISPYFLENTTINGNQEFAHVYLDEYVDVTLEAGQTNIPVVIGGDIEGLDLYYRISGDENYFPLTTNNGAFEITNAQEINSYSVWMNTEGAGDGDYICLLSIEIEQYNRPMSKYVWNVVSFSGSYTTEVGFNNTRNNSFYTGFYAVDAEDENVIYTNTKVYTDSSRTTLVDLTDITSFAGKNVYLAVFDDENNFIAGREDWVGTIFTDMHNNRVGSSDNVINVGDATTYSFDYSVKNSDVSVVATINGEPSIELTTDVTPAEYKIQITYGGKTYTYTCDIIISKSADMNTVADNINNVYVKSTTNQSINWKVSRLVSTGLGSISLNSSEYNAGNITQLKVNEIEGLYLTGLKAGYEITSKDVINVGSNFYLKFVLHYTPQGGSDDPGEHDTQFFIHLRYQGEYNGDKGADIYVSGMNGSTQIQAMNFTVNLTAYETVSIMLNNEYATFVIKSGENVIARPENGTWYITNFEFPSAGSYTLVITATDGTTAVYTIEVVGESAPLMEVVVGGVTLTETIGNYGPEGAFKYSETVNGNVEFKAYLGNYIQEPTSLINNGKITIESFEAALFGSSVVYGADGTNLGMLPFDNIEVPVQDIDTDMPYVMAYTSVEVEEGVSLTAYVYIYLCEEPALKYMDITVGDTTLEGFMVLNGNDMPTFSGDLYHMEIEEEEGGVSHALIGYVGSKLYNGEEYYTIDNISINPEAESIFGSVSLYSIENIDEPSEIVFNNNTATNIRVKVFPTVEEVGAPYMALVLVANDVSIPIVLVFSDNPYAPIEYINVTAGDKTLTGTIEVGEYGAEFSGDFALVEIEVDDVYKEFLVGYLGAGVYDGTSATFVVDRMELSPAFESIFGSVAVYMPDGSEIEFTDYVAENIEFEVLFDDYFGGPFVGCVVDVGGDSLPVVMVLGNDSKEAIKYIEIEEGGESLEGFVALVPGQEVPNFSGDLPLQDFGDGLLGLVAYVGEEAYNSASGTITIDRISITPEAEMAFGAVRITTTGMTEIELTDLTAQNIELTTSSETYFSKPFATVVLHAGDMQIALFIVCAENEIPFIELVTGSTNLKGFATFTEEKVIESCTGDFELEFDAQGPILITHLPGISVPEGGTFSKVFSKIAFDPEICKNIPNFQVSYNGVDGLVELELDENYMITDVSVGGFNQEDQAPCILLLVGDLSDANRCIWVFLIFDMV